MAEWRPFGASNQPDTCLWCGNKLRQQYKWTEPPRDLPWGDRKQWLKDNQIPYEKKGDYHDGFFCGLRCGYSFGERLAQLGRRLVGGGES